MAVVAPSQAPAFQWTPPGSTFGAADEAIELAIKLGQDVAEPEIALLHTLLAEDRSGRWAGFGSGVVCGRQNLKTWGIRQSVIYDAFVRNPRRIVFSAHLFSTTRDSFNEMDGLIQTHDWLRKRVKKTTYGNGDEAIHLTNGTKIEFVARSLKGSRGLAGDSTVLDEWLFGTGGMLGALVPTMSTAQNPHILYGSSPGLLTSEALRDIRNRGRALNDPSLTYIEWTSPWGPCVTEDCLHLPGTIGCVLDDEDRWFMANPALGRRISLDYVRKERREIPPAEFMRERLGWWEDPPGGGGITVYPMDEWEALKNEEARHQDGANMVFALDMSWDRKRVSVSICEPLGGADLVKVIAVIDPSHVKQFFNERIRQYMPLGVAIQRNPAPSGSLEQTLTDLGLNVVLMNGGEMAQAAGTFLDAIRSKTVTHTGDVQVDKAMETAVSRALDTGWVIDRMKSPMDTSGVVSMTQARWLLRKLLGDTDYDLAGSVH